MVLRSKLIKISAVEGKNFRIRQKHIQILVFKYENWSKFWFSRSKFFNISQNFGFLGGIFVKFGC